MNRRLVPVIGTILATFAVGGFLVASPIVALASLASLVVFLLVVAAAAGRGAATEPAWSRAPGALEARPLGPVRGTPHEISRALGAVESRELLYSPWFAVAVGLLLVILLSGVFSAGFDLGMGTVWMQTVHLAPWFAHPIAGMTIIAVFRAVTRSKRDDTDELFDGCPCGRDIRTAGHLWTSVVPVGAFGIFAVSYIVALNVESSDLHGPVTWTVLAIILASFVLVIGASFLGTALGAWLPYGLVPMVAIVAIGFSSLLLRSSGDPGWNGIASLSTVGPEGDNPMLIRLTSPWAYLAWTSALTVIVGAIAMARYSRRRTVGIAGATGVVAAVIAGTFAVQPVTADGANDVAALIMHPGDHQTCATTPNQVISICTFDDYSDLRGRVAEDLVPVADELKGLAVPMIVRQTYDGSIGGLPELVLHIVGDRLPDIPGNEVWIGYDGSRDALLADRLAVALWALDAPHTRREEAAPESIAGQARGVLALWIAARGLGADDALDLASIDEEWDTPDDAFERGYAWPSGCGPVVWSAQDLEAARAVMGLPEQQVRGVLHHDVEQWADPATSTDTLMAALGLDPVGPAETVDVRPEDYC